MMLRELLSTPAVLLGLVTFIGLCLQKKSVDYIIKGTITTVIGYTLLSVGSNVLQTQALNDFATLISFDFHVQGVVPNMEAVASLGISLYLFNWAPHTIYGLFISCSFKTESYGILANCDCGRLSFRVAYVHYAWCYAKGHGSGCKK